MKLRLISVTILLFVVAVSFSVAQNNTLWTVKIGLVNGTSSEFDTVGIGINYTGCIDNDTSLHLPVNETEQPPIPPSGVLDCRLTEYSCLGQGVKADYHAGSFSASKVDTFKVLFVPAADSVPWTLQWDTSKIHQKLDSMKLMDAFGGFVVKLDMMSTNSLEIQKGQPAASLPFLYVYAWWKPIDPNFVGVLERNKGGKLPAAFALKQNYPNPFNPTTTVEFSILKSAFTEVTVYNILGQKVATLVDQQLSPGVYKTRWNAKDDNGASVSTGVYFIHMKANYGTGTAFNDIRKIVLMK